MVLYIDSNQNVNDIKFQTLKFELKGKGWTIHTSNNWTWKRNEIIKNNIEIILTKGIDTGYVDV